MGKRQGWVQSADGTRIAYEEAGEGPVVILVAAALADRSGTARVATQLAGRFRVIGYDRRGRGQSEDTAPYAVAREVEDIAALIGAAGGPVCLFGNSSGAVLALEAATRLGARVRKLFLYEPPFLVDSSHPPPPADLREQIEAELRAGRRNEAVKLFFGRGMGLPGFVVTLMRWLMPGWGKMRATARTLPYDLQILAGTQSGRPLPAGRWAGVHAETLVAVGSKSEPFFHSGAQALVPMLERARYASLDGLDHSAILMSAKALAAAAGDFFLAGE